MPGPETPELQIRPYRDDDFAEVTGLESAGVHERYRSAVFVRQMGALAPATFLVAGPGRPWSGLRWDLLSRTIPDRHGSSA